MQGIHRQCRLRTGMHEAPEGMNPVWHFRQVVPSALHCRHLVTALTKHWLCRQGSKQAEAGYGPGLAPGPASAFTTAGEHNAVLKPRLNEQGALFRSKHGLQGWNGERAARATAHQTRGLHMPLCTQCPADVGCRKWLTGVQPSPNGTKPFWQAIHFWPSALHLVHLVAGPTWQGA